MDKDWQDACEDAENAGWDETDAHLDKVATDYIEEY